MTLNPNRKKLGRYQKKMLDDMRRYGDGMWKPNWHTNTQQRECLESLHKRGLVEPVILRDGPNRHATYRLVQP